MKSQDAFWILIRVVVVVVAVVVVFCCDCDYNNSCCNSLGSCQAQKVSDSLALVLIQKIFSVWSDLKLFPQRSKLSRLVATRGFKMRFLYNAPFSSKYLENSTLCSKTQFKTTSRNLTLTTGNFQIQLWKLNRKEI